MDSGIKKINKKEIDFSFDNWDTKHEYGYSSIKSNNIPVEEVELNSITYQNGLNTNIGIKYGNINYSKEIEQIGYRAQGITTINDKYVAISAYDFENAKTAAAGTSAIFFYEIETGEYCGKFGLGNYAHVGGVSYDKDHGILFVSDRKGKVMTLDFSNSVFINRLIEYMKLHKKENKDIDLSGFLLKNDIYVDNTDIKKTSTMYYNNGKLYIATCNQKGGTGQVICLDIRGVDNDRNVLYTKNEPNGYSIPGFTQGICVTNYEGIDYLLTTQSCDENESVITVQNLRDGSKIGSFNLKQPGAESLTIDKDGKIICCFEYGKKRIFETTMKKLMDSLDS